MTEGYVKKIFAVNSNTQYKKVVVTTNKKIFNAEIVDENGWIYGETTNFVEPFSFVTHVFYLPDINLNSNFIFRGTDAAGNICECHVDVDLIECSAPDELIERYDSKIEVLQESTTDLADGVSYKILTCQNSNNMPVMVFAFLLKKGKFSFEVGTADDGYMKDTAIATVEAQAWARNKRGQFVIGATNADFFDMFNDNAPSGLCVKDSKAIANANTTRNFFGFTKNKECVIGNFADNPFLKGQLHSAVGGREIFLKNGEIAEFSPGEAFSYTCHPRTAVGVTKDGDAIIMVVDGRIPTYSNGASLIDLARLMQKLGASDAINLDGGGSSIFLVRNGDEYAVLNVPADLERPNDKLIRPIYNSVQIVVDKK